MGGGKGAAWTSESPLLRRTDLGGPAHVEEKIFQRGPPLTQRQAFPPIDRERKRAGIARAQEHVPVAGKGNCLTGSQIAFQLFHSAATDGDPGGFRGVHEEAQSRHGSYRRLLWLLCGHKI